MSTRSNRILSLVMAFVMLFAICGDTATAFASVLTLPAALKTIGARAFYGSASVDEVVIPDGTTSIGEEAFANSSVTKVTIPSTVTTIGADAFANSALTEIVFTGDSEQWAALDIAEGAIPEGTKVSTAVKIVAYGECGEGVTWTLDSNGLLTISGEGEITDVPWRPDYMDDVITVEIADGVTGIGEAFSGCSNMTSITIPDSVESIDAYAFERCTSLESIVIPDGVTSIGVLAFSDCSSLANVTIPDSVTTIEAYAFSGCSSLESIAIPKSVTYIGEVAFEDCSSLESIVIPDGVTSIGEGTFAGCANLTSITIPDSLTTIEA